MKITKIFSHGRMGGTRAKNKYSGKMKPNLVLV